MQLGWRNARGKFPKDSAYIVPSHYISRCPLCSSGLRSSMSASALVRENHSFHNSPPHICLPATVSGLSSSVNLQVLVDSGADDNFINSDFVYSTKFPAVRMDSPKRVSANDGSPLESITQQIVTLSLTISSNHHEHLRFLVIPSPSSPMVFGLPWLKLHNPHFD